MRKTKYFLIAALAGALVGAGITHLYERQGSVHQAEVWKQALQERGDLWLSTDLNADVLESASTLTAIRSGDIDYLIKLKEERLSEAIQELIAHYPDALSNTLSAKVLKTAARYRTKYPFKTGDDKLDKSVDQILTQAESRRSGSGTNQF